MLLNRRSFTLLEVLVVIAIIAIILSLVLPGVNTMWREVHVKNAKQKIANLLNVARARSELTLHTSYGLLFYIDPITGRQVMVFVDAFAYPISDDETWPDVCDRYRVDTKNPNFFLVEDNVRIAPLKSMNWTSEELQNNDYRAGRHRNFFAIIFNQGVRSYIKFLLLYDLDNDDNGLGDVTLLPIGETIGLFGGVMRDIVKDINDNMLMIETDWGFRVYDERLFKELAPDHVDKVPYLNYVLTRSGQPVLLGK